MYVFVEQQQSNYGQAVGSGGAQHVPHQAQGAQETGTGNSAVHLKNKMYHTTSNLELVCEFADHAPLTAALASCPPKQELII